MSFTAIGIYIGKALAPGAVSISPGGSNQLQDVINILDEKYVDTVSGGKLYEEAITEMLHKLDPHSAYIPAKDAKRAAEDIQGKFGGVGIRFALIRDTICVTNVIAGSPSERAGLHGGDKILKIDAKEVGGKIKNTDEVMGLLRGVEGTAVNVTIMRNRQQFVRKIVRGSIPVASVVAAHMLDAGTGYIRIDQFSVATAEEFRQAAYDLKNKGMSKLVLDLRDNPGGVLQSAEEIADEFLPKGRGIVTVKGAHIRTEKLSSSGNGKLTNIKVAILMNEGSASASEVLAGALQDNDRATIIGRRSFGKGYVQQDFALRDGSDLRLVIARYYTPSGRSIQKPYDGNIADYYHDADRREINGELFAPDTTLFVDSLKFKTVSGRTVYGGGGIMPDIFVALDTSNFSWYYIQLRYSQAFQNFAFDYVAGKRQQWPSADAFDRTFTVTDKMATDLAHYAARYHEVPFDGKALKPAMPFIRRTLKGEIARQLFMERGYFLVTEKDDNDVKRALKFFQTGK